MCILMQNNKNTCNFSSTVSIDYGNFIFQIPSYAQTVLRLHAFDGFLHISQLKRISPPIFSTISHGNCPFHSSNVFLFKFGPVVLLFFLAFPTVLATKTRNGAAEADAYPHTECLT